MEAERHWRAVPSSLALHRRRRGTRPWGKMRQPGVSPRHRHGRIARARPRRRVRSTTAARCCEWMPLSHRAASGGGQGLGADGREPGQGVGAECRVPGGQEPPLHAGKARSTSHGSKHEARAETDASEACPGRVNGRSREQGLPATTSCLRPATRGVRAFATFRKPSSTSFTSTTGPRPPCVGGRGGEAASASEPDPEAATRCATRWKVFSGAVESRVSTCLRQT